MFKPSYSAVGSFLLFGALLAMVCADAVAGADPTTRPAAATTTGPATLTQASASTRPTGEIKTEDTDSDEPKWDDFAGLVGLPKDSAKVMAFIARYRLVASMPGDSGVYKNKDVPITLIYTGNKIARVVVRVYNPYPPVTSRTINGVSFTAPPAPVYHGDLVNGIRPFDHSGDVVRRLGPPTHEVELQMVYYKELGLTFKFDVEKHRLYEVDIDERPED